jgi:hypothetical protein
MLKVQSSYIPKNWDKNQKNKKMGYLCWLGYKIKSKHYTDDKKLANALLTFDN